MAALWVTGMFLFFDRVNISLAVPHIKQDLGLTGVQTGMMVRVLEDLCVMFDYKAPEDEPPADQIEVAA